MSSTRNSRNNAGSDEQEAQARIVSRLIDHDAGNFSKLLNATAHAIRLTNCQQVLSVFCVGGGCTTALSGWVAARSGLNASVGAVVDLRDRISALRTEHCMLAH